MNLEKVVYKRGKNPNSHGHNKGKTWKIKDTSKYSGNKYHKIDCICSVCKAMRGELIDENHPMFGKPRPPHKKDCLCYYCKAQRGERKGENHPMYGKSLTLHKKDCQCFCCKATRGEYKGNQNVLGKTWKVKDTSKMKEAQNRPEVKENNRKRNLGVNNARYKDGLTQLQRQEKLAGRKRPEQCEICGSSKKIEFDHDHNYSKTDPNSFRGWLCHQCNTALGFAKDSPKILRDLAEYLEITKALNENK